MNTILKRWINLSRDELDSIYMQATAGPLPTGDMRGTAIVTGSLMPRTLARFARLFAWQGKVFDIFADNGNSGVLINKITPWSLNFIVAKVYRDKSWMDDKETIVIDYTRTSFFAQFIRDEIRQVEPGLYLGKVWWKKTRILDFALTVPQQLQDGSNDPGDSKKTESTRKRTGADASASGSTTSESTPTPDVIAERNQTSFTKRQLLLVPDTLPGS